MNCVSWYEAMAFCIWDGGYLPTEAEWNYAAAGGDMQRAYPWSSPATSLTVDDTRASYNDGSGCVGDGMSGCASTDLVAVGTKPAGAGTWGHADLAGNVFEWTLDWISMTYGNPCTDCAELTPSTNRVIRGGSYNAIADAMRAGFRLSGLPTGHGAVIGVRCARMP